MTILVTAFVTFFITVLGVVVYVSSTSSSKQVLYKLEHSDGPDDPQFVQAINHLLGPPSVGGNRIDLLSNGDEIFPALLTAIGEARTTICFETFIYWEGDVGRRLKDAIVDRARAGVATHILIDWLGSNRIDKIYLQELEEAGAEVERYHPIRWYNLDRLNNRTHRKLLIIDGQIGFTGGVGIADQWAGDAQDSEHWRDLHFRVEGPVVAQLQAAFMDNWIHSRSCVPLGQDYFPPLEPRGECVAQMFRSSGRGGAESMRLMFLLGISAARTSLDIGNAYFLPDDLLVESLVSAAHSGTRVRVVVPGKHIDATIVRNASRARWGKLLEAGVQIHEYQPTMLHTKLMIVDKKWATVGSTNFDNRSMRLNDEANLSVFGEAFAAQLTEQFTHDLTRCRRVTYAEWKARPLFEKFRERTAALLRSQL